MKEYLLIILMVLASIICSVLCRQLIRSNVQIRRQIAEMEGKIEEAKTPKAIARKSQAIQHQSVVTASAGHATNAELRQEKRQLALRLENLIGAVDEVIDRLEVRVVEIASLLHLRDEGVEIGFKRCHSQVPPSSCTAS